MVISLFPKSIVQASSKQTSESGLSRFSISEGNERRIVIKNAQIRYTFMPGETLRLTDSMGRKVSLHPRDNKYYEVNLEGFGCHYSDIVITPTSLEYTDSNGIPRMFQWAEEEGGLVLRSTLPSKPNIDYATVRTPSLLSFGTLAHFDILPCLIPADYALYIAFLMIKNFVQNKF